MNLSTEYSIVRIANRDYTYAAYWISPQGEVIDIIGTTHAVWAVQNIPELVEKYSGGWVAERVVDDALKLGWVRVRGDVIHVWRWDNDTEFFAKKFARSHPANYKNDVFLKIRDRIQELSLPEFLAA